MPIEHELGTLIRRMNPYTNGTWGTMLFESAGGVPVVAPAVAAAARVAVATAAASATQAATEAAAAANQAVAALARARSAAAAAIRARRAGDRAQAAGGAAPGDAAIAEFHRARAAADAAVAAAEAAAKAADPHINLAHIDVVIDDFIANYSSADWVFRGQPQTVKRALRITYRYQVMNTQQPLQPIPGVYATEHILVGYAGGNGSA